MNISLATGLKPTAQRETLHRAGNVQLLFLLFAFFAVHVQAQNKQTYNWYFGDGAGMTWNTTQTVGTLSGLPTPLTGSQMSYEEGCITVSDGNGQLLFYSNGITIWNRNHAIMTDGLTGEFINKYYAVQSATVIPHPGNVNQYIVLTIGVNSNANFAYTVVDMTLNGGLGNVIATQKNIPLTGAVGTLGESVAAVKHANGTDYWIVAVGKGAGTSAMNVWKVTAAGVHTALYHSDPLPVTVDPAAESNGYLRFSLDGKYFAWAEGIFLSKPDFFFGEFDPNKGFFPKIETMTIDAYKYAASYGVEFSPSGKILYVSTYFGKCNLHIYRFEDLLASSNPSALSHNIVPNSGDVMALQLGPDGRIYGAMRGGSSPSLLVIDNVEDYDNYTCTEVSGLVPSTSPVLSGLPTFPSEWLRSFFPMANPDTITMFSGSTHIIDVLANDSLGECTSSTVNISITEPPSVSGAVAAFNAGKKLVYTPPGDFTGRDSVTYTFTCGSFSGTAKVLVKVYPKPDNVGEADCFVDIPEIDWGIEQAFTSNTSKQKMTAYTTPLVGDLDGDSIPEILVYNFRSGTDPRTVDSVYVFWGHDRANPTRFKIPTTSYMHPMGALARVKIGVDTIPMLVFQATDGFLYAYNPVTEQPIATWNGGSPGSGRSDAQVNNWVSASAVTPQAVGFTDFDSDGNVEVYASNSVWAAENGKLLVRGDVTGNKGYVQANGNSSYKHYYTVAADFDDDGKPELAAGTQVYEVHTPDRNGLGATNTMTVKYQIPGQTANGLTITDGTTIVADVNRDGQLDVIISSNNGVNNYGLVVWDPMKQTVIATGGSTGALYPAMPFAGNIDEDPNMEILYIAYVSPNGRLDGWRYNGTTTLQRPYTMKHTDTSGATGITMFDFDSDDIPELVYRDEDSIRIMKADATTSTIINLKTFPCGSGTYKEYPIVADVDGEGSSAILVMGGAKSAVSPATLRIYKSNGQDWAPARKVWNQYNYNVVNINEDLTVPRYWFNPATFFPGPDGQLGTSDDTQPYNNFLQQQTALSKNGTPYWEASDYAIENVQKDYNSGEDALVITFCIKNNGAVQGATPFYVSVYKNLRQADSVVVTESFPNIPAPGQEICGYSIRVDGVVNSSDINSLHLWINDKGGGTSVNAECNEDDDEVSYDITGAVRALNDYASVFACEATDIPILANDEYAGTTFEITGAPKYGSANQFSGGQLRYDTYGVSCEQSSNHIDTMRYKIESILWSAEASVFVKIYSKPDMMLEDSCSVNPKIALSNSYDGFTYKWEYSPDDISEWEDVTPADNHATKLNITKTKTGLYRLTILYDNGKTHQMQKGLKVTANKTVQLPGGITWYEFSSTTTDITW
jgi:hypothetical protein